jgi:magnesium transporter
MLSTTFTGIIISSFEDALSKVVVLTAYIPMLMGTGGNSGSQSSVMVIRGLSLGEIEVRDILKVLWKEIRVSVLCGVSLAVACYAKLIFVDGMLLDTSGLDSTVALVIALTLCATVICAKLIGCVLPIAAKVLKLDPAVVASPFITTIVDAVSLLVYFGVAKSLIPQLM